MKEKCNLPVGVSHFLDLPEERLVLFELFEGRNFFDFLFKRGEFVHVAQEPAVDFGEVMNLFHSPAALECFADVEETREVRSDEFCADMLVGELGILAVLAVDAVSAAPGFE